MNKFYTKTIKKELSFTGTGIHSGKEINLKLVPTAENSGIKFIRKDLADFVIPLDPQFLVSGSRATVLVKEGKKIVTPEHLLAALAILGITDIQIEMDNEEVPILDGSAKVYVSAIENVGLKIFKNSIKPIIIKEPLFIKEEHKLILLFPAEKFLISYFLDLPNSFISSQLLSIEVGEKHLKESVANARTFGFYDEYQQLLSQGLAKGANFENTVVIGKDKFMNELRFEDELVKHKILDLIGDLKILNRPILGHIISIKAGHSLNSKLVDLLSHY